MKPAVKLFTSFFIFIISMSLFSQKYETHNYETLFSDDSFEVRMYEPCLLYTSPSPRDS